MGIKEEEGVAKARAGLYCLRGEGRVGKFDHPARRKKN